jgi:hypothetical protein
VEEERVGRIVLKMERETGKESGMTEGWRKAGERKRKNTEEMKGIEKNGYRGATEKETNKHVDR